MARNKTLAVSTRVDNSQDPGQRPFQPQEQTELAALNAQGIGGRLFVSC